MLGTLLALFVFHVTGHNYVNTPSRALIAAVTVPCQQRVDPAPHLQVGRGQTFQLEWSTGHGETPTAVAYWVFLKEDAYDSLIDLTDAQLDDYLNQAPDASLLTGQQWARNHLAPLDHVNAGYFTDILINKSLTSADSNFIVRNEVAVKKSFYNWHQNVQQYAYTPEAHLGDRRAQYHSAKYPWILSAHKFRINAHWPEDYDIATFQFPSDVAAGNYIAHFKWGGYRDCTDVSIMNMPSVPNPWGLVQTDGVSGTFIRLDHCEYTFVLNPSTPCRVMTDTNASQCLADCLKAEGAFGCTGVQAVLKTNPPNTLPYTPNYPYKKYTRVDFVTTAETGPCDGRTIHKRKDCGDIEPLCGDDELAGATDTNYICYGLTPYRDQDFQTLNDYVITTDPGDPGFYSSCWVRLTPGGFLASTPPAQPPIVWQTGEKCLSCDWITNTLQTLPFSSAPPWAQAFTTECEECDIEKAAGCEAEIDFVENGHPGTCGLLVANNQSCSIECDSGFRVFGGARQCTDGILTGFEQRCVFAGC